MNCHCEKDKKKGQWLKIAFFCPQIALEAVSDVLAVVSGSGVEQSPEANGGAWLSGFFYLEEGDAAQTTEESRLLCEIRQKLADIFTLYDLVLPELQQTRLADEDWATSWQQFFKAFAIVPGLVIKPSWEEYVPMVGERVLEMDPGMAFGTGQHASTRGALTLLARCVASHIPEKALDVGTGTGILAMALAMWGAQEVLAIDNDEEAVRVARENVANNHLSGQVTVGITPLEKLSETYDLICANIVHDVLLTMLPDFVRLAATPSYLILAGILAGDQERNLTRHFAKAGFTLLGCEYEDEWVSLLLTR